MKQVVQGVSGGEVRVLDVPPPTIGPTEVLVRTIVSVISPGTERAVTSLARSSLLSKARARPDLVRQVIAKAKTQGLGPTIRTVRSRLEDDIPLGYSAAGVAVEVGDAVPHIRPGQLVATGGAGKANHAEFQAVPGLLCAEVPEGVTAAEASFATLATVALHGLRQASVDTGAKVVVVGLGLVGQLSLRLARASGCDAMGIDVSEYPVDRAMSAGLRAALDDGEQTTESVLSWSRGRGADAVLVCAGGQGSKLMERIPPLCRDRAEIVIVGDVGLQIDRRPFYEKELSLKLSRSYGPGRYERAYEDWGVDYPAGHLRWTEGRNLEAILDLIRDGQLSVTDLVTHSFDIAQAREAYQLVEGRKENHLAIQLTYQTPSADSGRPERSIRIRPSGHRSDDALAIGWVGAGNFSRATLMPAFKAAGGCHFVAAASASGLSARRFAERAGFERVASGAGGVIDDPEVEAVVIATPHDSHASLAAMALRGGKHVWVEKPLALTDAELAQVEEARSGGGQLFVGFNRRFSPSVSTLRDALAGRSAPLSINYRVAAGVVPDKHWYADRRQGGRLLGEVCHFIDTCTALVDRRILDVRAACGTRGESLLADAFAVIITYVDGSVSTVSYSSASPDQIGKELVEVLCGRIHARIDDYRSVQINGKDAWSGPQDKGHSQAVKAFLASVRSSDASLESAFLESSRATLRAAADLGGPQA